MVNQNSRKGNARSSLFALLQIVASVSILLLLATALASAVFAAPLINASVSLINESIQGGLIGQFAIKVTNIGDTPLIDIRARDLFDAATLNFTTANQSPSDTGSGFVDFNITGSVAPGQGLDLVVNFTMLKNGSSTNSINATAIAPNSSLIEIFFPFSFPIYGDDQEPDNNPAQARIVPLNGSIIQHDFGIGGDQDWLRFNGRQGSKYLIETKNITPFLAKNTTDTFVTVFDENLSLITFHDDNIAGTDFNSRVLFTAPHSGTFFVRITEAQSLATGVYTVEVREFGRLSFETFSVASTQITRGQVISMSTALRCVGGPCPLTEVILDPQDVGGIDLESGTAKKDPTYLDLLERGERVPVIIKLKDQPAKKGVGASLVRAASVKRQESFIESMEDQAPGFSVAARFDALNSLSATVDKDAYEEIMRSGEVLAVYPDLPVRASLNDSRRIIRADVAQNVSLIPFNITGRGLGACVVDTGVNYGHADFGSCSVGQLINDTCPRVSPGFDFVNNDSDPVDDNGHGSHVAGIIGSQDSFFMGVAPTVRIVPLKVLDEDGEGLISDVVKGINWCIANATKFNISSITLSLGDGTRSQAACDLNNPFTDAINTARKQNISVFVASGNDGFGAANDDGISSPACVTNATSVGSTTKVDGISSFTNRAQILDLFAPGQAIRATLFIDGVSHQTLSGTSQAAPHASGVAALLQDLAQSRLRVHLSPESIDHALKFYGVPIRDDVLAAATQQVFPRIDAFAALGAKGVVSTERGAIPFWTPSQNPQSCGNMSENQSCGLAWTVNATGPAGIYEFFTIAQNSVDQNTSNRINVSLKDAVGNFSLRKFSPGAVNASAQFGFTINFTNNGQAPLTNVSITDTFNASDFLFTTTSLTPATNSTAGDLGRVNYTIFSVPVNTTVSFTISFLALNRSDSANLSNNVSATAFDGNLTLADQTGANIEVRFINFPPTFNSTPPLNVTVGAVYVYNVDAVDANQDILSFSLSTAPVGMVINSSSGIITWSPTLAQVGLNAVQVSVLDGRGSNVSQNFNINVSRNNSAPVITSIPISTAAERSLYTYNLTATDADNDAITFGLETAPAGMSINSFNGRITWIPVNGQVGSNPVTVIVFDNASSNSTQSYSIVVTNTAPSVNSTAPTTANQSVPLIYDPSTSDEGSGNGFYRLVVAPIGMTLVSNVTGVINWTPNISQIGPNFVSLQFNDGNGGLIDHNFTIIVTSSADALVNVAIAPSPVIMSSAISVKINVTNAGLKNLTDPFLDVRFNASDLALINVTGLTIDSQTNGSLELDPLVDIAPGQSFDGTLFFLALNRSANVSSRINVTLNATDEIFDVIRSTIGVAQIAIVNFPPMINSTPITDALAGSVYTYNVTAIDANNDTLSFSLLTVPSGMSINVSSGRISWFPLFSQAGLHNVSVVVSDGGLNTSQNFTINVSRNNSAPNVTTQAVLNATEDVFYVYDVNASDLENDTFSFFLAVAPAGMQITSSAGLINFTPNNTQVGLINVTVTVIDALNASSNQSYVLNVSNVVPIFTTTPLILANESFAFSYDANTTDEGQGAGALYSLTLAPAGMSVNIATGLVSWTPNTTQIGQNNASLRFTDGNNGNVDQNFTITVAQISDALVLVRTIPDPVNMSSQVLVLVNLTNTGRKILTDPFVHLVFNASDLALVNVSGQLISQANGSVVFGPIANLSPNQSTNATVTFLAVNRSQNISSRVNTTVNASDVAVVVSRSNISIIRVLTVNFPPVINSTPITTAIAGSAYTYNVTASDANNDTLTFSLPVLPSGMSINASSGRIIWFPLFSQAGLHNVSVVVSDGVFAISQNFTINVSRNNSAPNVTTQAVLNATEDVFYVYDVNASDLENDTFSFFLAVAPAGMQITNSTGVINFTPNNTQVGLINVTVTSIDALNASSNQSYVLNVSNVVPVFTTSALLAANESITYIYDANTTDEGQGAGALYSLNLAPGGMAVDAVTGRVNWTPNTSQIGQNNVSLRFTDGNGGNVDQNFTVTVTRISNISIRAIVSPTTINMSNQFNVVLNFTNTGAKNLTNPVLIIDFNQSDMGFVSANVNPVFSNATSVRWENVSNLTQNSSIIINATFVAFNRSNTSASNLSITASAFDGVIGLQVNASVAVQIVFVNFAPVITSAPILVAQSGTAYEYNVTATDGNNDTLSFNLTNRPFNMAINAASGRISWFPLFNQSGLHNVTVVVFDGRGANATQNFVINVSRNNTAPVITTTAITNATEDVNYTYDVNASDLENDSITFSLGVSPAGMSINTTTGVINFVARNFQVGSQNVSVNATDVFGNSSIQSFTLVVTNNLAALVFNTTPIITAIEGVLFTYDPNATDEGDGAVFYALNISPVGMTINNATGLITWTPNSTQAGQNNVSIIFNDGNGGIIAQAFVITVNDTTKPTINVTFPPANAKFNVSNITLAFSASDNHQVISCGRVLNGNNNSIFTGSVNSSINATASIVGIEGANSLEVFCFDAFGNRQNVSVAYTIDTIAPAIFVTSPPNGFNTSGNIQVTFNIIEPNFLNATLIANNTVINLNQSGTLFLTVPDALNQNFTIIANDQLNHTNSTTVFFNVDRQPPRVTVPLNITRLIFDGGGAFVILNASNISDNFQVTSVTWDVDNRDGIQIDGNVPEVPFNYSVPATFIATVTVTDPAGNQNVSQVTVFVLRDTDGDGIEDFFINGSPKDLCPYISDVSNNATRCVGDKDGDGIIDPEDFILGFAVNVITNQPIALIVGNQTNPNSTNGSAQVSFVANGVTLVTFPYFFNQSTTIEMGNLTLVTQAGGTIMNGLILPQPFTKTLTVFKGNVSHNAACVVDAQIATLSSVSAACLGAGEVQVNCTVSGASNGGFTCTDLGSSVSVNGLRHSAIKTFFVSPPPATPTPGVVSSGGSTSGGFRDDGSRSSGGVTFESSPPLFTPRRSSSADFDDAQVVVNQFSTKGDARTTPTASKQTTPTKTVAKPAVDQPETERLSVSSDNILIVLILAIIIVLIGIAAITYVWKL